MLFIPGAERAAAGGSRIRWKAGSAALIASLASGILLGFLDFFTGPFLQFPFFFLVPIGFASWYSGRRAGCLLAVLLPLARPLMWYPIWKHGSTYDEVVELGFRTLAANAAIKIMVFSLFAELMHRLADAARFRRQILATMPIGLWVSDKRGKILQASPVGAAIWGAEAQGKTPANLGIRTAASDSGEPPKPGIPGLDSALRSGRTSMGESLRILRPDGEERTLLSSSAPIRDARGGIVGALLVQVDVTESKRLEKERETLILSLQEAQRDIQILRGILPICSGCKRIRDDRQSWVDLESYISSHSEADFSHGICPDCVKTLYPWFTP